MAQFYRTDSPLSYIYIHIYTYIYTPFHNTRVDICFSTQMAQFYHTRETNNLDGDLSITISHTPMYTHIHTNVLFVLQIAHHHTYIYVCINLFHHTVKHLSYRTDSPPSCMYIHIHTYSVSPHRVNICFTTQMAQFYHTRETHNLDGDLCITILYTRICTHIYCLFYRYHIILYIYILCFATQS